LTPTKVVETEVTMIRALLAAAFVVVISATAALSSPLPAKYYRDQMPSQFRGAWCGGQGNTMRKCSATRDEGDIIVTAKGFTGTESVCEHVKIILVDLNPNHLSVKFRCALMEEMAATKTDVWGAENGWMAVLDMRLTNGRLVIKDEN